MFYEESNDWYDWYACILFDEWPINDGFLVCPVILALMNIVAIWIKFYRAL